MKRINADGSTVPLGNYTFDISPSCESIGDVAFIGAQANFNGGYIVCSLPDFDQMVLTYTQQEGECLCRLDQKAPPWVAAKFTAAGVNRTNPLVYLGNDTGSDFRYTFQIDGAAGYTELTFPAWSSIRSPNFTWGNTSNTTFTGYNPDWVMSTLDFAGNSHYAFLHDPALRLAARDTAADSFLAWPSTPPHRVVPTPGNEPMSPTRLYIGGSPEVNERFIGLIETLSVDPGCVGHGGGGG